MNVKNLHTFITVMHTQSISLAADKLCLTQPAVSKRIKILEEEFGVRLFDTVGRGIVPTFAACELLPVAKRWLGDYHDVKLSLQHSETLGGRLVIGTSHHIGLHHLAPILKRFIKMYPHVSIEVCFLDSEQAHQAVLNAEVALAFLTLPPAFDQRLAYRLLWPDPLYVVAGKLWGLANKPTLSLQTLTHQLAILPASDTFTTQITISEFAKYGLKPQTVMTVNPLEQIQMLVSVGLGWSVLPTTLINEDIIKLSLDEPFHLVRQLGVVTNPAITQSPAASALLDLCDESVD